ncbi:hypothetical protein LL912_12435 [Niabella sp. CC-SYL272]|uniref:hypothetical protein n=1 Tax=Niabella agricola TaxID=2891571 RepID=UPI001F43C83A|nr:hypothetical protein [Niabella agricola]MCF3109580.1 hypothetical protein [Niabella agricola]
MKSLKVLNNVERAALLFDLFPDETPGVAEFVRNMAITVMEDREQIGKAWDNAELAFDKWLGIAKAIRNRTTRVGIRSGTVGYFYAELLFAGQLAVFSTYCLITYVTDRKHPDHKFSWMVRILFE